MDKKEGKKESRNRKWKEEKEKKRKKSGEKEEQSKSHKRKERSGRGLTFGFLTLKCNWRKWLEKERVGKRGFSLWLREETIILLRCFSGLELTVEMSKAL